MGDMDVPIYDVLFSGPHPQPGIPTVVWFVGDVSKEYPERGSLAPNGTPPRGLAAKWGKRRLTLLEAEAQLSLRERQWFGGMVDGKLVTPWWHVDGNYYADDGSLLEPVPEDYLRPMGFPGGDAELLSEARRRLGCVLTTFGPYPSHVRMYTLWRVLRARMAEAGTL